MSVHLSHGNITIHCTNKTWGVDFSPSSDNNGNNEMHLSSSPTAAYTTIMLLLINSDSNKWSRIVIISVSVSVGILAMMCIGTIIVIFMAKRRNKRRMFDLVKK